MQVLDRPVNESGFKLNNGFDQCQYIHERDVEKLANYICSNLVGINSSRYWNEQYNYLNKLYHVIRWRKKKHLIPAAKKGEAICNDQLINFFEDRNHKNTIVCLKNSVNEYQQTLFSLKKQIRQEKEQICAEEIANHNNILRDNRISASIPCILLCTEILESKKTSN